MAITMDYGYITVAQVELRRSADAAAMAACWELYDQVSENSDSTGAATEIESIANATAFANTIGGEGPSFFANDVQLGLYDINQPGVFIESQNSNANAVRVTLRRQSAANGTVPLFFGALTGRDEQSLHSTATAAMFKSIQGFLSPSNSSKTVNILPFALDLPTWNDIAAGNGPDNFRFDGSHVQNGGDGIPECNLYPKGNGSPGNRGTVDIGKPNNSTRDISRQILHGISALDFADLGQPLELNGSGYLNLNGDTGISAGVKDELATIVGQKRIIPIFESVHGNGNNAMYKIVKFEGVRILGVKLTGPKNKKHLTVQPAATLARGAIIDRTGASSSSYLYSPVMLVD